jgi:hypothetical protein
MGNMKSDKEYHEVAKWVCPSLGEGVISYIARHMDCFEEDTIIDYLNLPDGELMFFNTVCKSKYSPLEVELERGTYREYSKLRTRRCNK